MIIYSDDPNFEPIKINGPAKLVHTSNASEMIVDHATDTKKRWYEAEKALLELREAKWICQYAQKFTNKDRWNADRWYEAEKVLLELKNPKWIYCYAHRTLNSRWVEAEPILLNSGEAEWIYEYTKTQYGRRRWAKAEKVLLKLKDPEWLCHYTKEIKRGRWRKAEEILLELKDHYWICHYAEEVIEGRWRKAEKILKNHTSWDNYLTRIRKRKQLIAQIQEQLKN